VPHSFSWTRWLGCLLFVVAAASGARAQDAKTDEALVRIETALGSIDIAVDAKHAPVTAANFLKYVDAKLFDGGRFHRVTRPDNYTPAPPDRPAMAIIQGGIDPARRGEGFPAIPLERTSVTGLKHVVGTVSMARGAQADSARSDFFICLDEQPSLDFGGKRFDDAQGAAAFGRVVKGLDVVRRIQEQPTNKDADTSMGRQTLTAPVTITRMSRIQ
jgi:peptidyl-prolyl cis-trans isomerase A (cyclophilin A)